MKAIQYKITILIAIACYISCGKEKKNQIASPTVEKDEVVIASDKDLNVTDTKSQVVFTDETIDYIYNQYLLVKRGLVNSNAKIVQQEAKKLSELIENKTVSKQLKAIVKLISLTKDIEKQRDFFVTLTAETETIVSLSLIHI